MKKFQEFGNNKIKFVILFLFGLLSIHFSSASVIINEVMYNPDQCSDNYCEWMELYNDGNDVDLTNWTLCGNNLLQGYVNRSGFIHLNTTNILYSGSYAIISDGGSGTEIYENFNANNNSLALHVNVSSICGGLTSNKTIILNDSSGMLIDSILINSSIGGDNDNNSLQLCSQNWTANYPTPGYQNNCTQQTPQENETDENQTNQQNQNQTESYINIIDAPNDAEFGDKIEIEFEVYKGDTSKYAVYLYIEDEDGKRITDKTTFHFRTKFTNYNTMTEIELPCVNKSGDYYVIVEGLDERDKKSIDIDSCNESVSQQNVSSNNEDFLYDVIIPSAIKINEEFSIKVKITNNLDTAQNFSIWSYVYKGSKCYSCLGNETREGNVKQISINAKSYAEVELKNEVYDAEAGDYNLKIKILKGDLKTPKEFTYNVMIEPSGEPSDENIGQTVSDISAHAVATGVIESKSSSIAKSTPYLLATVFLLFIIYLIIKKSN